MRCGCGRKREQGPGAPVPRATRLVEPYALAFKRRKDGGACEYFYASERTVGRTSGPGIKRFVATDVEAIAVTDEAFEPRYEIELAKAGDADSAGHFASTRSLRLIPAPRRWALSAGTSYTVEFSYCGTRFRRQRLSLTPNPHKGQYGNRCYGRVGHQVW